MTDEYDPEVNVLPMIAAIRCFGESITEPKGKAVPGDFRITFGRLLVCCADGMHMDSLNGTLKRAAGKSNDSPYKGANKLITFKGKMLMFPAHKDVIIRLLKDKVPSEEDCAKARTALSDGKQYGVKDAAKALKEAGLSTANILGK
mmetsp:Transcript_24855/g.36471  ORF Transcript_24855/g.36471 Transcript_24855/m.36471 type:complete len:146 (+) Transcript_24855:79-516(+)|eukprot:CAMPEP_0195518624 /NCGR_PEP_ID=MMETSP0794_2-20130614/13349_1 /TAXON_ID=515487 /ORGANISM="Stephanopyxis turris, Strain CCMP 815" /LENGTH=145 /DNA_ID=CAMNT_0040647631 /DNA_START=78 /DNA_END=515 /DNA_ORIENTATION=+